MLEATSLQVDNTHGPTHASGPGRFMHLGLSDSDPAAPGMPGGPAPAGGINVPQPKGGGKRERVMKLTRIDFKGRMYSNTKNAQKNAKFYDGVEVFNVPAQVFQVPLDPDKLPKNGFYLKCEQLEVQSRKVGDRTLQAMVASEQVYFKNADVSGRCDQLCFDDENDMIIFKSRPGGEVQLIQRTPTGEKRIPGETILYNRKTGEVSVEKAGVIRASSLGRPRLIALARLDAHGEDQTLVRFGAAARDDRQELAAHRTIDDLALVRRDDRECDLVVLVGAMLHGDMG